MSILQFDIDRSECTTSGVGLLVLITQSRSGSIKTIVSTTCCCLLGAIVVLIGKFVC